MNFEQVFSFDDVILPLIKDEVRRASRKKGQNDVQPDLEIKQESNAHVVGQFTDNVLLFTWNGKKEESGKEVTFFGLYNLTTKESKRVFEYDQKIDVVSASVNDEKTLLAFTVIEFKLAFDNKNDETVGIYKSFIAEISPKNRVFSLAIERPQYQRVEFLRGKYPLYGSSVRRESHMLFFHHSQSIDLYHIPLARIDGGMVMCGQPQVETIARGFVWAQIDQLNKRLYYVYRANDSTNDQAKDGATERKLMFSAVQFCERSPHVLAVKMRCPFPLCSNGGHPTGRFQYDRKVLTAVIAESHVNMQVVTSAEGSFFLCYQHSPVMERRLSQESVLSSEESDGSMENETQQTVLEYSVLIGHHGSILKCKIPNVIPESFVDCSKLLFTMFKDCVAVILPGYVFHLLDCNADHPPCHHLILQELDSIRLSDSGQPSEFLHINNVATAFNKEGLLLFEPQLCKIFKLSFDNNYWTDCFLSTHRDSTRLALLHFSLLHIQDPEIISQIFSHLVRDPANLECSDILKEYLIGSTHFQMKFQVDASVYKFLPFSSIEPFRGHLEMDRKGKKIARITYSTFKANDIFTENFRDEKRKELEFWISLKQNISFTSSVESPNSRFSLKNVAMVEDGQMVNSFVKVDNTGFTSILRRFRKFPYVEPHASQSADSVHEYVPEFLEIVKSDPISTSDEKNVMKVLESLTRYLHRHLPSEIPKLKIQNMAAEYTRCQKKQSSNLLQMFWSGLYYTEDTHPYREPLSQRGSSRDRALFMLLERYHVAVKELCFPFPAGFQVFFTSMGFRCLEPKLFIQYVTNGIFELESEFMYRLLQDTGNDESYSHLIFRLISSFEQSKAIHFLDKWNSPSVSRLLCQRYVSNLLTEGSVPLQSDSRDFLSQSQRFDEYERTVSSLMSSTDEQSEPTLPFRPLLNVLKALEATVQPEKKTRNGKANERNQASVSNSNLSFVAQRAMQHTANAVDDSLGLMAF